MRSTAHGRATGASPALRAAWWRELPEFSRRRGPRPAPEHCGGGRWGAASVVFSLPWCCILPGLFAFGGVSSAFFARTVAGQLLPFFLLFSLILLGRSYYLIYVKRQGTRWSQITVVLSTVVVLGLWVTRFKPLWL